MLGRLSRSSSQNSLSINEDVPIQGQRHNENAGTEQVYVSADADQSISECVRFTREHPLGAILLKLAQDNTALAKKANLRGVETNIVELCTSFHNAIQFEKADIKNKFIKTHRDIEDSIINKELNSHTLNSAVKPPQFFSPTPTLTSGTKWLEALRIFPYNTKFSGTGSDNAMSVTEFLHAMKTAQDQLPLSEDEFINKLLSGTTGLAHELILEWRTNGENVSTIYHNLLINFDKRLSPEEAKQQLIAIKISKDMNLAKAESKIMLLASRASSQMPEGPSRTAYYNLEACNNIIRALPSISSANVNNIYNQISARLGRAATFAELSQAMNLYRVSIDNDIKINGAPTQYKQIRQRMPQFNFKSSTIMPRRRFTAFDLTAEHEESEDDTLMPWHSEESNGTNNNNVSYTPRPLKDVQTFYKLASQNNHRPYYGRNMSHYQDRRWDPNREDGNFLRMNSNFTPFTMKTCWACGLRGHMIQSCTNIVNDYGEQIQLFPTQDTCTICPETIYPRLMHPESLCPYRPGAPLHNTLMN